MKNLNQILKILIDAEVDFVLIGGFASVVHGATQVTRDVDICAALTDESLNELREALRETNPVHRMNPNFTPSFDDEPKTSQGLNAVYLKTDYGVVDILKEVKPVGDFNRIKSKAVEVNLFGKKVKVISIEDLIAVKESLGREKDRLVLKQLKSIKDRG